MKEITPEDWLASGYKRFNEVKHFKPYAEFGLQKCIRDELGKCYFITVYVYDNFNSIMDIGPRWSFAPDVQFCFEDKPTVNIELGTSGCNWSIASIEQQIHELWVFLGKPYYERYND